MGFAVLIVLAFVNGANDVGKSVASLMLSSGFSKSRTVYRPLLWGGLFSGLGSVLAVLISGRLFSVFTSQNFLRTAVAPSFALAALVGATVWILAATLFRLPVSTTHAIVGAVVLQGAYLFGTSGLEWDFLVWRVLLPLAAGPFAALAGVYLLGRLTRGRQASQSQSSGLPGIAHWGSAAATSFARGVNDAPKLVALGAFLFAAGGLGGGWLPYLIIAVAVVAGSLVWGDRVAWTMVGRAASLDEGQRVKAGAATAALLSAGAYFGDPLSATDVSAGASAGAGGARKYLRSAAKGMALAWTVTLPAAGFLAILASICGAWLWG